MTIHQLTEPNGQPILIRFGYLLTARHINGLTEIRMRDLDEAVKVVETVDEIHKKLFPSAVPSDLPAQDGIVLEVITQNPKQQFDRSRYPVYHRND